MKRDHRWVTSLVLGHRCVQRVRAAKCRADSWPHQPAGDLLPPRVSDNAALPDPPICHTAQLLDHSNPGRLSAAMGIRTRIQATHLEALRPAPYLLPTRTAPPRPFQLPGAKVVSKPARFLMGSDGSAARAVPINRPLGADRHHPRVSMKRRSASLAAQAVGPDR